MAKPTKHRGKWRIRWTDHAGKRQSEVYERYKDAEQALRRHQIEVDEVRGGARLPVVRDKTFNDLCDYWLATRAKEKRSQKDDRTAGMSSSSRRSSGTTRESDGGPQPAAGEMVSRM